jgi:hypothetical protein
MEFQRGQVTEVKEVFDQLKENFRPGQVNRDTVFNFILDEELWTVSLGREGCTVEENRNSQFADCTLQMPKDIFLGSFNGSYKPSMMDLFSGKIKIDRPEMLFAFKEIFGAF